MAEPVSSTATAGAAVGIMALLVGWLGNAGADVMMVILGALSGCFIALSGAPPQSIPEALRFLTASVLVSMVCAWSIAGVVANFAPMWQGPYLPSLIGFGIGFASKRMYRVLDLLLDKGENAIGIKEKGND